MKKTIFIFWTIIIYLLTLSSCDTQDVATPGFTGSLNEYSFFYTEIRDQAWEEDILFLADKYLSDHPYLAETPVITEIYTGLDSDVCYEMSGALFDASLRSSFIDQINELIISVSSLEDIEIEYELQRIVASLGDAHSQLAIPMGSMIPVFFEPILGEDGYDFVVVRAPEEFESIIGSKLIAMNNMLIENIVEELSVYVSYDNPNGIANKLAAPYSYTLLSQKAALKKINVLETEDEYVELTLETDNSIQNVHIPILKIKEIERMSLVCHEMVSAKALRFEKETNYWYTMMEDGTLYVRFRVMQQALDYSLSRFLTDVDAILADENAPEKLIIDFRDNMGGDLFRNEMASFADRINKSNVQDVYVLINGNAFSAGITVPYLLASAIENAQLIGSPASHCLNYCMNTFSYTLPNAGNPFWISTQYFMSVPNSDTPILEPEIIVHQPIEEFNNKLDSVISYILEE